MTLDFDRRYRRRLRFCTDQGAEILLDLPEAMHIRDGDALALEDGVAGRGPCRGRSRCWKFPPPRRTC